MLYYNLHSNWLFSLPSNLHFDFYFNLRFHLHINLHFNLHSKLHFNSHFNLHLSCSFLFIIQFTFQLTLQELMIFKTFNFENKSIQKDQQIETTETHPFIFHIAKKKRNIYGSTNIFIIIKKTKGATMTECSIPKHIFEITKLKICRTYEIEVHEKAASNMCSQTYREPSEHSNNNRKHVVGHTG